MAITQFMKHSLNKTFSKAAEFSLLFFLIQYITMVCCCWFLYYIGFYHHSYDGISRIMGLYFFISFNQFLTAYYFSIWFLIFRYIYPATRKVLASMAVTFLYLIVFFFVLDSIEGFLDLFVLDLQSVFVIPFWSGIFIASLIMAAVTNKISSR